MRIPSQDPKRYFNSFNGLNIGIYSARPLKDLSDTEITAYLDLIGHSHPDNPPSHIENTATASIDGMMSNYISGLETSFPSIVATTGRTSDKLDFPITSNEKAICLVCAMPKQPDNVKAWLDNITVREPAPGEIQAETEESKINDDSDVTGDVCYGCYTLFRSSRGMVEWPV